MITIEIPENAEQNALLGRWVEERLPGVKYHNFQAFAWLKKGKGIVAVTLFHNYRNVDMEVVHVAEGQWATRDCITKVLAYPFSVGCSRITALIRKDNKKSRKMVRQLGFKEEGKLRRAERDGSDLFVYGLLADEYRFARK